jgi:hypothetical protein
MCTACDEDERFSSATATSMPTYASEKALPPTHPRDPIFDRRSRLTQPRSEGRTLKSHTHAEGTMCIARVMAGEVSLDDRALCYITHHDYLHTYLTRMASSELRFSD